MRSILRSRALKLVFTANAVSMIGSGMNSAAVTWYILQATHSEMALGTLVMLATIPALLMLPFSGVIIDREDRRRLVMVLDAARAVVILAVAILAFRHEVQVWQLYLMQILVAAGFWMFWPTVTALVQELTPGEEFLRANTVLLAGFQGGWLLAGAVVGWMYNRVGLGGVLLIDVSSYVISFLCYFAVRRGRVVVAPPQHDVPRPEGSLARFLHEAKEGMTFLRERPYVVALGTSWGLFVAAMLAQGVVSAPLSDRLLHAGAVGYGWLNAGWAIGAFTAALYAPLVIPPLGSRRAIAISMGLLACCLYFLPFSRVLPVAFAMYIVMGSGRGVGGVGLSSAVMEVVPKHFMGRVQNTFYFGATALQIVLALGVGAAAHRIGLVWGFAIIGSVYLASAISALWPASQPAALAATSESSV